MPLLLLLQVCGLTKLTFEPPCIYCVTCGQRIKRGQTYHCTPMEPGSEFRGFWCHGCLQEHKGDRIPWEGAQVRTSWGLLGNKRKCWWRLAARPGGRVVLIVVLLLPLPRALHTTSCAAAASC